MQTSRSTNVAALAIGAILGSAVAGLSTKAVIIPLGIVFLFLLFASPGLPYLTVVALTPMNVGFGGFITVSRMGVLAVLAAITYQALTRCSSWPRIIRGPGGYVALAYFVGIVLTTIAHSLPGLIDRIGPQFIYAVIFFLTLAYVHTPRDMNRVMMVIVGVAVFEVILVFLDVKYGIVPFGGWHAELLRDRAGMEVRAAGTHEHPITLAGYFQVAIPCALTLAVLNRNVIVKLLLVALTVSFVVGWHYTFSRSSMIGMAVLVFTAMLTTTRITRMLGIVGIIGALLVFSSWGFSLTDLVRDLDGFPMLQKIVAKAGVSAASESMAWRFENWGMSLSIIKQHLLLGIGIDEVPRHAIQNLPLNAYTHRYLGVALPHNMFLQVAAENGMVMLFLYISLWIMAFRGAFMAYRDTLFRPYGTLLLIILSSQLGIYMFNPMAREVWLVLGLSLAMGNAVRGKRASERVPEREPAIALTHP
ncbi:MAG TPA: hypothetical protein ENI68_03555 [Gammaproteobacteria bacterium]|nr:hypothetical protein [Gammaproteobacteria bacterium]